MIATDLHEDTIRLIQALEACPMGGTVTFGKLSEVINRDITTCRHLLYRAIKVMEREHGTVFIAEHRIGIRRMIPAELHKVGQTARARVRSHSRRAAQTIAAGIARANDMPMGALHEALREQSILGLIEHAASERNRPALTPSERPASPAEVARAFLSEMAK